MTTTFEHLIIQLHAELRRDGRYHSDCPFCGKETKKAQKHFSFCADGYICWVCEAKGGLQKLAQHIGAGAMVTQPVKRAERPQEPRLWQQRPDYYLSRYTGALDRVTRWMAYKPLTLESIIRWKLGVGMLPASRATHRRLILPVFAEGRIVAFHGRAYAADDTDAKWLTAGGSSKQVLFNGDLLRPGAIVVVCENFVDCILAMQAASQVVAVAGGGASWRTEWSLQIAAARPKRVLVWFDHDWAGNCGPNHCAVCQSAYAKWRAEHPSIQHIPEPRGPKVANELLELNVNTHLYEWQKGTPAKHDIGAALMAK